MDYFKELAEKGITHYEAQQGEKIIRHLERGEVEKAEIRLLSFSDNVGVIRSLNFLKRLASRTEAWGSFHRLLLNYLGAPELFGVDIQPETFIDTLIASEPKTREDLTNATYEAIESVIKLQLENDDAYFIDIEPLGNSFLAHLVPDILEIRNKLSQKAMVRRISGNALDISELFRSPHALRLLLTAGFGARITEDQAPLVDELLTQIDYPVRISGSIDRSQSPFSDRNPSEIYKDLFSRVSPRRKEYLVNLLYSVDWNEELQIDGLKYIGKVGHQFSVGPLINALESKSSLIVTEGARGLGLLQAQSVMSMLEKLQARNETDIKQAATIALARLGMGKTSRSLKNIIGEADEEVKVEASLALANLKTEKSGEMLRELVLKMDLIELFRISGEIAFSGNINLVPGFIRLLFPQYDDSPQLKLLGILQRAGVGDGAGKQEDIFGRFRDMAITALGRLGSSAVLPIAAILEVLSNSDEFTPLVSGSTSTDPSHPAIEDAVGIFRDVMRERYRIYHRPAHMEWSLPDMVKNMVKALGLTGAKEAIPILKEFAEIEVSENLEDMKEKVAKLDIVLGDRTSMIREKEFVMQAIEALSEIDVPALETLMSLKQPSDPEIRRHLTLHVGSIFDARSIDWLTKQLQDDEITVRITAAMCLLLQRNEESIQPLKDFIIEADKATKVILGSGIARLNEPIHIPLVEMMYSMKDPEISRAIRAGKMTKITQSDDEFWA